MRKLPTDLQVKSIELPRFLLEIGEFAKSLNNHTFLVGGGVRDLLMNQSLLDYDVLCERNAIDLAQQLQACGMTTTLSLHPAFATAKIRLNADPKIEIDLATMRSETYARPGALPKVIHPVSIEQDLYRRDFTINAIAHSLVNPHELIDPFGGLEDLAQLKIRVIHNESYFEDPTRILRAVRFALRFGFSIVPNDIDLIRTALKHPQVVGLAERLRGLRIGIELQRILELPHWIKAIEQLNILGVQRMLSKQDFTLCIKDPYEKLVSWQSRLIWVLQDAPNFQNLVKTLGIGAENVRLAELFELLRSGEIVANLKFARLIQALSPDQRSNLCGLIDNFGTLYKLIEQAIPIESPTSLIENGYTGEALGKKLEEIFRINLRTKLLSNKIDASMLHLKIEDS